MMNDLKRTVFYERHAALGAKLVEFGGWEMPLFYPTGIVTEHLTTRTGAGLFDVSHMGRFGFCGCDALSFLQHVLSNNAQALDLFRGQYTVIPTETGGAVDDAYLYRFEENEFLLVVNASNQDKDWRHFAGIKGGFGDVVMENLTEDLAMLSLQGPDSRRIMGEIATGGRMPEPFRNYLGKVTIAGEEIKVSRTGYTGDPVGFELFIPRGKALEIFDLILAKGAAPAGLGARDTLRLEAALPLYGHEYGVDPEGVEIPIMASPPAKFGVSFSPLKGGYIGRAALARQFEAFKAIQFRDFSKRSDLPRIVKPLAMIGRGVCRAGARIFKDGRHIGFVTSGTTVPYRGASGEGLETVFTEEKKIRAIGLALVDSDILDEDRVEVEVRKNMVEAVIVPYHLRGEAPPFARPIIYGAALEAYRPPVGDKSGRAFKLMENAVSNTRWRQNDCLNFIPSEMTASPASRLLSIMDPAFRYAEHRKSEAFYDAEIFYYQGTAFIAEVERLLKEELKEYLGCLEVEARLLSGQMANTAVYSAIVDYINRVDRKKEPRRINMVMNNHIGKGGHLSAQPMGALKDYLARDPRTERPAVVNFPVLPEDRYRIDLPETFKLLDQYKPELIVFGKSMVLYPEPIAEVRKFLKMHGQNLLIMYDMAHVLGLIGPHFQEPFKDGTDIVTGSTHKTFFGTQRGVVGVRFEEHEERYELWEALERRTFPGSVSNHHLGTLLGLLMSAYEMNHFKDQYQPKVIANAKAFAKALKDRGLDVAGDPSVGYTQTHQVIVKVGYAQGPAMAARLEKNNIICNFQATPDEEGFTAAGALRLGVSEMTRFGMEEKDFDEAADFMAEVILKEKDVAEKVSSFRRQFTRLKFQFDGNGFSSLFRELHRLI